MLILGSQRQPPLCPYYGFNTRPSLYAYNRASKVVPVPVLVSLHAPFYMHIIRYPRLPPPPYAHILVLKDAPLCVLVLCSPHTRPSPYAYIWISKGNPLHMLRSGPNLYTHISLSKHAALYIPTLRSPVTPPLSACISFSKHIRLTLAHI
jgi:hypothetical protein